MKQDQFIEQKKISWDKLSKLLNIVEKKSIKDFDKEKLLELGSLYRQVTSDLSYAKSNFKDRQLIRYLNQLVARAHSQVYSPEPFNTGTLIYFYYYSFPKLFRQVFLYILLSVLIFTGATVISFIIVKISSNKAAMFLPETMIVPVEEGLKEDDVGAKFESNVAPLLSSQIMTNNISVGFKAFAFGITLGVGTVYVLITNGFMLGSLAAIFNNHNCDLKFWSLILPHGITELTAIFICGGAGLILADAILKPGNLKRKDALKKNGNTAIQLILGVIPMFVIAGIIEGFITPLDISPWIKLIFSLFTLALLILYFMPLRKRVKGDA